MALNGATEENDVWRLQPSGSTLQNVTHIYQKQGIFPVYLSVSNSNGYSISQPTYITTFSYPTSSFIINGNTGLAPLSVNFIDTSVGPPTSWNWSFNNVTGNNTEVSFATTQNPQLILGVGDYSIRLNITNIFGSNITPYNTVFINVSNTSIWSFTNGCWTSIMGGTTVIMWNSTGTSSWNVPPGISNISYLIVGGGGGGAAGGTPYGAGGGGGAGGFLTGTLNSPSGIYTITVGNGGTGGIGTGGVIGSSGTNGGDSSFYTITATGGGAGGSNISGFNGGSGGGGGSLTPYSGGISIPSSPYQGNSGGSGDTSNARAGGGGGAFAAGNLISYNGGGTGNWSYITGINTSYAGGGGGVCI